jgi:phosphoglycerate dehydrogenase-like enzyme
VLKLFLRHRARRRAKVRKERRDSSHCPVCARHPRCGGRSIFLEFPEVEAVKADSLESLAEALDGAEIFVIYNSAFTPEFAQLVREKGRALKWIQFTTVGIDIALKAGLPDGVWITNSGGVS